MADLVLRLDRIAAQSCTAACLGAQGLRKVAPASTLLSGVRHGLSAWPLQRP